MEYSFVLEKDGKEVEKEKGDLELEQLLGKLDAIAVRQKE